LNWKKHITMECKNAWGLLGHGVHSGIDCSLGTG
jgi:hypothetical protein